MVQSNFRPWLVPASPNKPHATYGHQDGREHQHDRTRDAQWWVGDHHARDNRDHNAARDSASTGQLW
jgi:hypothetical protein